ncbi:MAG: quinone-dependent dihydroorotate dehydrogenase [Bacteroidota bacterium]|nr:quinone-dependent dihydroorotate dehydrogenase [Bacteroidota bacterium]
MYSLIKKVLFKFSPESVHYMTMDGLRLANALKLIPSFGKKYQVPVQLSGIEFPNVVGLAAGFDKNAKYIEELRALGFGSIEIGTLTPLPQSGNDKPRLFRLTTDEALINRMGFNNDGAGVISQRLLGLRKQGYKGIIGGNIGKNKQTDNKDAHTDYIKCFDAIQDYVDYIAINVSSPNTPRLRALQDLDSLTKIVDEVGHRNAKRSKKLPVFVKIAPDLENEALNDIVKLTEVSSVQGIITTNTTISREHLKTNPEMINTIGNGGLSGLPLKILSREKLSYLRKALPNQVNIISSGGIMDAEEAKVRLRLGADIIQLYTGFIYSGPQLIADICKEYKNMNG